MSILLAIGIFFGGLCIGYFIHFWLISIQAYSGTLRISKGEDKTVFSLEVGEDPDILADRLLVIFKVETDFYAKRNRV